MNQLLKSKFFLLLILLVAILLIGSCAKDFDKIGLDIQPPGDKINLFRTDTVTVVAYSVPDDSVRTDEVMNINYIGGFFDPSFGKTTASVYTEFLLSTVNHSFGASPVIDSIILNLAYSGLYGDTLSSQTFRVFELMENIQYDTTYYSNHSVPVFENRELGNLTFIPNVKDSITVGKVKKAPHLRMRLNQNLAQKLLSGTEEDYANNLTFRTFFKGLYITATPANVSGKGALIGFNFLSALTSLDVYYKNNADDSLFYSFTSTQINVRFNRFDQHQYADADPLLRQQIISGNTSAGGQKIFLQPFGGVKVRVLIPYLKEWAKIKNVVINEAQLVFYNADQNSPLAVPSYLDMRRVVDTTNKLAYLEDQYEGESYFGGYYNSTSRDFRFRLNRYVQKQIMQKYETDNGLLLVVPRTSPERTILHGSQAGTGSIKMTITYTIP